MASLTAGPLRLARGGKGALGSSRYIRAMDHSDLRQRLAEILAEEDREVVNWATVDELLDRLDRDLTGKECPRFIRHFIADSHIRAKDPDFANQRLEVRQFVDTGEYQESKEIVLPLGCVAVLALAGLGLWLS